MAHNVIANSDQSKHNAGFFEYFGAKKSITAELLLLEIQFPHNAKSSRKMIGRQKFDVRPCSSLESLPELGKPPRERKLRVRYFSVFH